MVADTSVLIDLERGNLLEQSFTLPFRFKVPDLLYQERAFEQTGRAGIRRAPSPVRVGSG